jgi:hypothetical protein
MACIFPLKGMVGMIKKKTRNLIPVLRTNWACVPQVPQRISWLVSSDPQKKTFVPMINIAAPVYYKSPYLPLNKSSTSPIFTPNKFNLRRVGNFSAGER